MSNFVPETPQSLLKKLTSETASDPQWHRFVTLYTPVIRAWLKLTGLPVEQLDDALQTIFIRLVKKLRGQCYDVARGRFRTYLACIVRSTAVDLLRAKNVTQHQLIPDENHVETLPATTADIPFQVDAQFRLAVYDAALERLMQDTTLTPLQRDVLEGCILNDLSPTELCKKTAYPYHQVYRTLKRLQKRLQSMIDLWMI